MWIRRLQISGSNVPNVECKELEFFNLFFEESESGETRIAQSIVPFMSLNSSVQNGIVNLEVERSSQDSIYKGFRDYPVRFSLLSPETISQTPLLFSEAREILRSVHPVPVSFLEEISSFLSEWKKRLLHPGEFSEESPISEERTRVRELREKKKRLWQEIVERKRHLVSLLSSLSALQREIPHSLYRLENLERFPLHLCQSIRRLNEIEERLKERREEIDRNLKEIKSRAGQMQWNFEEISFPESFHENLQRIWGLLQELFQTEERVKKKREEKEKLEEERQSILKKWEDIHRVLHMDVEKWFSVLKGKQEEMRALKDEEEQCHKEMEQVKEQEAQHSRPASWRAHLASILLLLGFFLFFVFWKKVFLLLSVPSIPLFLFYFYGENRRKKVIQHLQEEERKRNERWKELEKLFNRVNMEFIQYQWKDKAAEVRKILGLERVQTAETDRDVLEKEKEVILRKIRELEMREREIAEMLSRVTEEEKRDEEKVKEVVQKIAGFLPAHHQVSENYSSLSLLNWWNNLSREYEEWERYKQLKEERQWVNNEVVRMGQDISRLLEVSGFTSMEELEKQEKEYLLYQKLKEVYQKNREVLERSEKIAVFRWNQPLRESGGVKSEWEIIKSSERLQKEIEVEEKHIEVLEKELSRLPEIPSVAEIEERMYEEKIRQEERKRKERVLAKSRALLEAVRHQWEEGFPPEFLYHLHQLLKDFGWNNTHTHWTAPLFSGESCFQNFSRSQCTIYSLAFRLAFLLAIPEGASIPLIMDDAFAFLMRGQKEKVFSVLSGMRERFQILYFTGRKEDLEILQHYFAPLRIRSLSLVQG